MNAGKLLLYSCIFALAFAFPWFAKASDAQLFQQLHDDVIRWKADATPEDLDYAQFAIGLLAECPGAEVKDTGGILFDIGDVHFRVLTVPFSEERNCLYMTSPFEKALNLTEARDLIAASILEPKDAREKREALRNALTPEKMQIGEKRFSEMRRLLHESPNAPDHSASAAGKYADCSNDPPQDLATQRGDGASQVIRDEAYTWYTFPWRGRLCVYVSTPLNRGLTPDEAVDLNAGGMTVFAADP
jgi:hypothetical protein